MIRQRFSSSMVLVLMVTQVLGSSILWAAEQRGIQIDFKDYVVVSAISEGLLIAESSSESKVLRFGEAVNVGEELRTGKGTVAEVLIGSRAVITLGEDTTAQVTKLSADQLTIQVGKGMVRVAASAHALGEKGTVIIQTPTSQVNTRGGIVRVVANATSESVAQVPVSEGKSYLASYSPHTMVVANNTEADIIQVEEGVAEILGAGPDGDALMVPSGQRVTRQAGQAGLMTDGEQYDTMRAGVLAKADHNTTPKEGVENLVALQVDQATQLGQALTGASKTKTQDAEKKDSNDNPVNGATGGVQVASTIVNTLFGGGSASNLNSPSPTETTGTGFGGNNNQVFSVVSAEGASVRVNGPARATEDGLKKPKSLLVFTAKEPFEPFLINMPCDNDCLTDELFDNGNLDRVTFNRIKEDGSNPLTITSEFTVAKELVLVGGTPNSGHEGEAPTETLILRGAAPRGIVESITNLATTSSPDTNNSGNGLFPSDSAPADVRVFNEMAGPAGDTPSPIASANSTFVVESASKVVSNGLRQIIGGTLGQFSSSSDVLLNPDTNSMEVIAIDDGRTFVDGAITATSTSQIPIVTLMGGVTLDRGTVATVGETTATNAYFTGPGSTFDNSVAKFNGSLLSIIDGPNGPTGLTVQDRLLGVYDGSKVILPGPNVDSGNKALLSVLDAKLKAPTNGAPLIDINAAYKDADEMNGEGSGARPEVAVTSAVVTRSTKPLDSALLEASAPILALTKATMTTTSHFADLAGNQASSIQLNDMNNALVALNASSQLSINGNLLHLNNATATVEGYLFSLNGGSTLSIGTGASDVGALFSLNNQSTLNLNGNAFGVFGSGDNKLAINNNLCAGVCGTLVNSANDPILLGGTELKVAGVTGNVVLPNSFNVFAGNSATNFDISEKAALIHVDDSSTLNINGTTVLQSKTP